MFNKILKYELKYQWGLYSTHIYFTIMFMLAFLATLGAGGTFTGVSVQFSDSSNKVMLNSAYYLHSVITAFGYIGIIFIAAISARTINRDIENGSYKWFYTLPVKKASFISGRFLGSTIILLYIMSAILAGTFLASVTPWVDPAKFAPTNFIFYIYPFITSIIPYVIFALALMTAVSLYFRSTLTLMITAIMMLMTYAIITEINIPLEYKYIVALFDPFGMFVLSHVTKYWTIAEQNTQLLPFSGVYLYNKLIFLGFSGALLAFAYKKFKFAILQSGSKKTLETEKVTIKSAVIPEPKIVKSAGSGLKKYYDLTLINFKFIIKSGPFIGLYVFWFVQTVINAKWIGEMHETSVYTVTSLVARRLYGNSIVFIIAIITIYSGELIWRERDRKFDGIVNSFPVSTFTLFMSKLSALVMMVYFLLGTNVIFGIVIQFFKGYYDFELGVYLKYYFIFAPVFLVLIALLSFVIHILVNHKFVAYSVVILYYLSNIFAAAFDLRHPLYRFGSLDFTYSDINAFGYTHRFTILGFYYFFIVGILLVIAKALWVRGNETGFKNRLKIMKNGFNGRTRAAFAVFTLATLSFGAYIFYNINVLDEYRTNADNEMASVNYEKEYGKYERLPQLTITDVDVNVDIYPKDRSLKCSGKYILKNNNEVSVTELHILSNKKVPHRYTFSAETKLTDSCEYVQYNIYELEDPVQPGDSITMDFVMEHSAKGFSGGGAVYNGTFINNFEYFPLIGYSPEMELSDVHKRKKHGLEAKDRMAPVNDPYEINRNYVGNASWINFRAVVSTSSDQTAIAPGVLEERWEENGRNFFRYKADRNILNFFNINSARYEVKRRKWKDIDLEVYYDGKHDRNIDHMLDMMELSLKTFTESFGPFQFPVLRIIEFPYGSFAQSFATTIPFSEKLGFIIDYEESSEKGTDYLADVTAHEIGHQWWAHQVISANTRGTTLLTEVMAQYSSYLVMMQIEEPKAIRTYMKYALDNYLSGRKKEDRKELPLTQNENQGYLHYYKGIMAMVAMDDLIGRDSLTSALRKFVADKRYSYGPYPVSTDILPYFHAVTPDSLSYLVDDLLTGIYVYENKAISAVTSETEDGKYLTKLTVASQKFEVDSLGNENAVPKKDYFNIGLLDEDDEPLYLEKYLIDTDTATFEIVTNEMPAKAGIDPYVLLIDRKREDNVISIDNL